MAAFSSRMMRDDPEDDPEHGAIGFHKTLAPRRPS
jgi:hypothetical protein